MRHVHFILCAALQLGCRDSEEVRPDTDTGLALQTIGNFSFPVFLTAPPNDSRLFIVEKRGTIKVVKDGATLDPPFLDIVDSVTDAGEQGLLGLAFHPEYAVNGIFVVNYIDRRGDTKIVMFRVSPTTSDVADPGTAQDLLTIDQPYANHNGGMLAFGPNDGHLYIGMGDGGSGGDPHGHGQNKSTLLGKMLRISVGNDGLVAIPPDNPLIDHAPARAEIWSWGLRNPWRFSFDRANGNLYIADVGQNQIEEIDVVTNAQGYGRGVNFGWNTMEGRSCFGSNGCSQTGLALPVLEYTHEDGCSVTGGYVYRGTAIPAIQGHYFYADYCERWVRSFRLVDDSATDRKEWPALDPGGSIVSFGEDAGGELYLMTSAGRVAKIVSAP